MMARPAASLDRRGPVRHAIGVSALLEGASEINESASHLPDLNANIHFNYHPFGRVKTNEKC